MFLGESVPRFDLVMGLVGSTLTGPLMFVFPPLFFLRLCYVRSKMKNFLPPRIKQRVIRYVEIENQQLNEKRQNGDLSKLPLVINRVQTQYRTFTDFEDVGPDIDMNDYSIKWYDVIFAVVVMLMGISATAVATYSSWTDAVSSAEFSPPCLINATAAARSFIITTHLEQ